MKNNKALLIYNPVSGNRTTPRNLDYILKRFQDSGTIVTPFRLSLNNEEMLLSLLKDDSLSFVVVSGGDGTVGSVVNVINHNGLKLPIGIIPSGTCNDFARSLGIPSDIRGCLDTIISGSICEVDAGLINGEHYFLNTCAGGNFVDVSYNTNSEFKKNFGPLAYYINALGGVANIKPVRLKITTDNEIIEQDFLFFLIVNGRHAAGFTNVVKDADISDGYMDILLLANCPPIELAGLFLKVMANDFLNDRNVIWLRTKSCFIEGSSTSALSVDGEKWSKLPIKVDFIHKSLKVFVKCQK